MPSLGTKTFYESVVNRAVSSEFIEPSTLIRVESVVSDLDSLMGGEAEGASGGVLFEVLTEFNRILKDKGVKHLFKPNELLIWVVLEILDTGSDFSEIDYWLCHEATLNEVVLDDDPDSLLSRFTNKKYRDNRRRFRAKLKKHGLYELHRRRKKKTPGSNNYPTPPPKNSHKKTKHKPNKNKGG